jgi:hypothetical protein
MAIFVFYSSSSYYARNFCLALEGSFVNSSWKFGAGEASLLEFEGAMLERLFDGIEPRD